MANFAEDYIDVAARIATFREQHPGGSLQPADLAKPYSIEQIGDQTFIVVVAAAYRDADDKRPGMGMAYEQFPGRTPYTRGSELQNAETSAWGRAIVAALAADTKKGIASAEEVRNRSAERSSKDGDLKRIKGEVWELAKKLSWDMETLSADYAARYGGQELAKANVAQLVDFRGLLTDIVNAEGESA